MEVKVSVKVLITPNMSLDSQDPPNEVYRKRGMPKTPAVHAHGSDRRFRELLYHLRS